MSYPLAHRREEEQSKGDSHIMGKTSSLLRTTVSLRTSLPCPTSIILICEIVDVINVVSVTASATVNQWDETNEEEVQAALYWRQAFDVRSMELSVSYCMGLQG